jgi:hypothetical protein
VIHGAILKKETCLNLTAAIFIDGIATKVTQMGGSGTGIMDAVT